MRFSLSSDGIARIRGSCDVPRSLATLSLPKFFESPGGTAKNSQGRQPNVIYFGSGRGASRPVEVVKTLAIHRRACDLPLKIIAVCAKVDVIGPFWPRAGPQTQRTASIALPSLDYSLILGRA